MENVGFYHTNSNVCLKNEFRIHFERMSANDVDIFKSQKILIEKFPPVNVIQIEPANQYHINSQ